LWPKPDTTAGLGDLGRNIGHGPPALLAHSPTGLIHFMPDSIKDERAKDNFARSHVTDRRYHGSSIV
jgi:hypothetical protein